MESLHFFKDFNAVALEIRLEAKPTEGKVGKPT